MPKYTTLKNAELEALLKERGLPHAGKKAEMVTRLEDDDKKKNEDEIDWDDEAGDAAAESAKPSEAAPISTAPEPAATDNKVDGNNPQAVPNQVAAIDPSTTQDLTVAEPAEAVAEAAKEEPKVDYTVGLPQTDAEKELAARKRRMERFNVKPDEQDPAAAEAQKLLERQQKFGGAATETVKIDSALSDQRKRGRESVDDRGDFKRGRGRSGRDGRGFRGGNRNGGGGGGGGLRNESANDRAPRQPRREGGGGGGGGSGWMNADDRAAADKRNARFGN